MISRNGLDVAETDDASRAGDRVTNRERACLAPTVIGQHLVIGRDPELGAVTQTQADALCLALVEAMDDGARMQFPELVSRNDMATFATLDDVLDAMRQSAHRVEHLGPSREALVLHDLDARAVADDLDPVLDRLDAPDVEPHRAVELQRPTTRRGFG